MYYILVLYYKYIRKLFAGVYTFLDLNNKKYKQMMIIIFHSNPISVVNCIGVSKYVSRFVCWILL